MDGYLLIMSIEVLVLHYFPKLVILSWPQITPLYFSRGLKLLENKILSSSNFKLRRSVAEPPDLVRSNFNGQEASLERGGYFFYSE